ncbi:hypothetical protein HDU85_006778 [Gaertneriomyces sp. JEL0708]|nr:hypothetical protein HDU85_006778 [Gaertneriomyces sp. JEL0708]
MSSNLTERTDEAVPTFTDAEAAPLLTNEQPPPTSSDIGTRESLTNRTVFVPNAAESDIEKRVAAAGAGGSWGAGLGEAGAVVGGSQTAPAGTRGTSENA